MGSHDRLTFRHLRSGSRRNSGSHRPETRCALERRTAVPARYRSDLGRRRRLCFRSGAIRKDDNSRRLRLSCPAALRISRQTPSPSSSPAPSSTRSSPIAPPRAAFCFALSLEAIRAALLDRARRMSSSTWRAAISPRSRRDYPSRRSNSSAAGHSHCRNMLSDIAPASRASRPSSAKSPDCTWSATPFTESAFPTWSARAERWPPNCSVLKLTVQIFLQLSQPLIRLMCLRKKSRAGRESPCRKSKKRLLIACSCLLLGSVEVLVQVLGVIRNSLALHSQFRRNIAQPDS